MGKITLSVVFFSSLLLSIFYFPIKPSHAQSSSCPLIFTPPQIDSNYNGDLVIKIPESSECVFQTSIEYNIKFCPSPDLDDIGKGRCDIDAARPIDSKTLNAKLDSGFALNRAKDQWFVTICIGGPTPECRKTIFATGFITVGADPTPTPPSDLPKIIATNQPQCAFQAGEEVSLTATNIIPGREYQWWWNGLRETHDIGVATGSNLKFTIPGSETTDVGIRNVCVEDKNGSRTKGQSQHCITLEFFPGKPPGDPSCEEANSGTTLFELIEEYHEVPPPPCAKFDPEDSEKCVVLKTAIGNISIEPPAFVKFIFSVVLGLAGGISLILIIISGYRIMASSGNPEALAAGRQQLISAIVGLLFIIFSFVILEVIGVDILRIPGFEK